MELLGEGLAWVTLVRDSIRVRVRVGIRVSGRVTVRDQAGFTQMAFGAMIAGRVYIS